MKRKELFDRTIGYLVKAYQDDTLEYNDCRACAVGNIVSGNLGLKLKLKYAYTNNWHVKQFRPDNFVANNLFLDSGVWGVGINCGRGTEVSLHNSDFLFPYKEFAAEQAKLTGYSLEELAKIEYAFYIGTDIDNNGHNNNFEGLMFVVDCLMKIHEADTDEIEGVKELFVKI